MLLCLAGCGGPLGPFAGGELTGADAKPPAQWQSVPETIQLEVRPAQPYSVNLWSVSLGPYLYVATGDEESGWAGHLRVDRNVRRCRRSSLDDEMARWITLARPHIAVVLQRGWLISVRARPVKE